MIDVEDMYHSFLDIHKRLWSVLSLQENILHAWNICIYTLCLYPICKLASVSFLLKILYVK